MRCILAFTDKASNAVSKRNTSSSISCNEGDNDENSPTRELLDYHFKVAKGAISPSTEPLITCNSPK